MVGQVVVLGAINTDLVISAPRLPVAGETVVGNGMQTFGGGKGANAAVAASRAGAKVMLIGAIGTDEWGTKAVKELQDDGINIDGVLRLDDQPTGAALIMVDAKGENQIAIGPGANGALSAAHVRTALSNMLEFADVVLISTEIPIEAVATAVELAARHGVKCILNPAPVIAGLDALMIHSPILTPNKIELADLLGDSNLADEDLALERGLQRLSEQTNASVIATLGAAGCAVYQGANNMQEIPAPVIANVIDTTGAGDTFNGVLAARMAMGDSLIEAVQIAVRAASISVGVVGARSGMPTAAMLGA